MRFLIFLLFILSLSSFRAQPLENGMIFRSPDGSYYSTYNEEKYTFYNKDSLALFALSFHDPVALDHSFYRGTSGGKIYVFNPKTNYIVQINPKYDLLYDADLIRVVRSSLSLDTLIELKDKVYMNLQGQLVFDRDAYTEIPNERKKYTFITEADGMEMEGMFKELREEEYDDYYKEQKRILELKNQFLLREEFEEIESIYDGYSSWNPVGTGIYMNERYIMVRKNKKTGVMSSLGRYIVPPIYDYIEIMEDEYHPGPGGNHFLIKAYDGSSCHVYNESGKKLFENKYLKFEFSYLNPAELGYDSYFGGLETRNKKKSGLIHRSGQEIIPPIYDSYDYFDFTHSSYMTFGDMGQKTGCGNYPYQQYFIGMNRKDPMHYFYAPNGQFLNKFELNYIDNYNPRGYFTFEHDGLYGLAQPGACVLKEAEFDYIDIFRGKKNVFIVSTAEHVSFIDGKGDPLFGQTFDMAYFVDTNFSIVTVNGKSGLMNVEESEQTIVWQIQPEYDRMESNGVYIANNGNRAFIVGKNKKVGIVDSRNKILTPLEYDEIKTFGSIFTTVKNHKQGLLDKKGAVLLENNYDSLQMLNYNGLWFAKKGIHWGFVNVEREKGKQELTAFEFENIQREDHSHCYVLQKNGKWGVMTFDFKWIVEPKYSLIRYDDVSKEFECVRDDKQKDCYFVK